MKVLIWTQYFWPENFHINQVARALHKQGVEVTVLTGKPNYPEGKIFEGYQAFGIYREKFAGFDVVRIPLRGRGVGSVKGLILNYLSFIFSGYIFAPLALHSQKYDLVFVYAPSPLLQALPAIFIAWLKRAPLILWVQDIWPEALESTGFIKNRMLLSLVKLVVRYIYNHSDLILIQSEGFRQSVERLVKNPQKIRFYPNSAEIGSLGSLADQHHSNVASSVAQSFSIVFAGNIGTVQSCETIIEAAKLLQGFQDIKFYLVGNGSMMESVANAIVINNLSNVIMTGRVPPEDIPSIYASASVLLLSLQNDPALSVTIPSKLQGYLAAGKPILVSSDGEPAKVLIQANAGLACPAGDADALAKAVKRLYGMSADDRSRLGENGYKFFIANYHLPDRVMELKAHFEQLVKNRA